METMVLGDLLDDLRAADQILRKFEQRYWLSSDVFYELYSQGLLDYGENMEDFAEWAGFYEIKQHREKLLHEFSDTSSSSSAKLLWNACRASVSKSCGVKLTMGPLNWLLQNPRWSLRDGVSAPRSVRAIRLYAT